MGISRSEPAVKLNLEPDRNPVHEIAWKTGTYLLRKRGSGRSVSYEMSIEADYNPSRVNYISYAVDGDFPIVLSITRNGKLRIPLRLVKSKTRVVILIGTRSKPSTQEVIRLDTNVFDHPQSAWSGDLGIAGSYLNYSETAGQKEFRITEAGLTIKAGVSLQISEDVQMGVNGYVTALPMIVQKTPTTLSSSRFYGVNGRLGVNVFEPSRKSKIYLMAGYYLYGQIQPDSSEENAYGIAHLGGPQVFVVNKFVTDEARNWYWYLKFATIQDGGSLMSTKNREIAGGVGFQISDPLEPRKWMLTADVSEAEFQEEHTVVPDSFRLITVSFGMSTDLW